MEFYNKGWNPKNYRGTSKAKAVIWVVTDTKKRKRREQTGLDTLVVYAVNYECSCLKKFRHLANALNTPPEKYNRKVEIQRNWRGLTQVVEYVV